MLNQRLVLRFVAILLVSFSTSSFAAAQNKKVRRPNDTPDERVRKIKSEPNNAYTRWLKEDVSLIIRPEEEAAFKKLTTDEEREAFIGYFWDLRDPDPDTEENEYREQHYERLAYASEHFSSGKPGWMTDRGRIYVKFGKPDEIEAHPSGGQYQLTAYEGYGSITTYPFEKWFYRHIAGVGSGVEIEFVDPSGSGEYRIAREPSEKYALAHVPGSGTPPEDLSGTNSFREGSPFAIARLADLEKAPEIEPGNIGGTGGPKIDDNPLDFDVRADYFKLSDNRVLTAFTVQTANKDLVFEDVGGLQTARLNIFGKIITVTDKRAGTFEDAVTTSATIAELTETKARASAYSKAVVLAPGVYRVDVVVRDVSSGATGVRHLGLRVPRYEDGKLATSSMILAAKLENMAGREAAGPFVIGQTKVIPNMTGLYHRGQPVGVYLQLYNAGIDQTTLRPSVDAEYALLKDGKEVRRQLEDWQGISDTGQRLTLARLLDTQNLTAGDYEVTIRIHDRVSGQNLAQAAKFRVVE